MFPLSPLMMRDIRGKRILLFENDVHTGKTLEASARELSKAAPQSIDALLIYHHSQVSPEKYPQITQHMPHQPLLKGRTLEGNLVLDTTANIPKDIRRWKTLECDFKSTPVNLGRVVKALSVSQVSEAQSLQEYTTVSFDLDGTIIERDFDYKLWGVQHYAPSEGVLWQMIGKKLNRSQEAVYHQSLDNIERVPCGEIAVQPWLDFHGVASQLTEQEVIDAVPIVVKTFPDYTGIMEKVRQKAKRVILVTESSGAMLERKLTEAGIKDHFDAIYSTPALVGTGKDIDSYAAVLQQEGVRNPTSVIHIGDSVRKDYFYPRTQGIHAYHLNRTGQESEVPSHHVIHSLQEVERLL